MSLSIEHKKEIEQEYYNHFERNTRMTRRTALRKLQKKHGFAMQYLREIIDSQMDENIMKNCNE